MAQTSPTWKLVNVLDEPGGSQWVNMYYIVRMRPTPRGTVLFFADATRTMVEGTPDNLVPAYDPVVQPLPAVLPEQLPWESTWNPETPDEADFAVPPDIGPQ